MVCVEAARARAQRRAQRPRVEPGREGATIPTRSCTERKIARLPVRMAATLTSCTSSSSPTPPAPLVSVGVRYCAAVMSAAVMSAAVRA